MKESKLLEKFKNRLKHAHEKAKEATEEVVEKVAVVGGGAAAGFISAKFPDASLAGINAGLGIGAALTLVGVFNVAGRSSNLIGDLGAGMLAYETGTRVFAAVNASGQQPSKKPEVTGALGMGSIPQLVSITREPSTARRG